MKTSVVPPSQTVLFQPPTTSSLRIRSAIRFCKGIVRLPLCGMSLMVVASLRIVSLACSILGQTSAASYFSYEAKKFRMLYGEHNIDYLKIPPLPVYAYSKNLAKRHVVFLEEDVKMIKRMRENFLSKQPDLAQNVIEKLRTSGCKGASFGGICFGAVLTILKTCLEAHISSEDELIHLAKGFEEGYDAEASGLQKIHSKTEASRVALIDDLKNELDFISDLEKKIPDFQLKLEKVKEATEEETKLISIHQQLIQKYETKYYQGQIEYYNMIAELLGLRIQTQPNALDEFRFWGFDTNEDVRHRFDILPNGVYHFTPIVGHAVSYLKYSFGSYILDPEYGLMPLQGLSPAEIILKLYKTKQVVIFRYGLI